MRTLIIAGVSALALGWGGTAMAIDSTSRTQAATHADLMQAQQKLQAEGLYKGKIDGVDGKATRAALMQYQKKNGLQASGQLDPQTEAKLGLNEASGSSMPSAKPAPGKAPIPSQAAPSITGGGTGTGKNTSGTGAKGMEK